MTFRDHFSARAQEYAAHRPSWPAGLVDLLAALAPSRAVAWDAGCGSGQLSLPLAAQFDRVIATDASARQIARAAAHPKVEYRTCRAEASGLPDDFVDLAVAAQAAHWFDIDAYYAEVRRVARPGAVVALASYGVMHAGEDIDPVIHHFHSHVLATYWPAERRHVEHGYRTLPFPFTELEAPRLEIRVEWTYAQVVGYVSTWSAVRALQDSHGRREVERFERDLARAWGDGGSARSIRWPLALRLGRVPAGAHSNHLPGRKAVTR